MPKERILNEEEPFNVRVGWTKNCGVQVGAEGTGGRSVFWQLFNDRSRQSSLGKAISDLAKSTPSMVASASSTDEYVRLGQDVLNILDSVTSSTHIPTESNYNQMLQTLDRAECNELIRLLRRARDQAFG